MHGSNVASPAGEAEASADLPLEVVRISSDLFPGPLTVHCDFDPELPDAQFLVLTVHADGDPKEVVQRRREWHRRVSQALPQVDIRLSITSV